MPVSIKMAKTQNLSLNPTKISGTCGRLMCCLKYEQNAYEDALKRMPKVESFVQTPDGPGNVKSVDLLRETVKVSLDSAPEPLKCYHNCEVCILRNGKGSRDGIAIPERTERYVEEKDEEVFTATPIFTTPFYMDSHLENAPVREKMGEESADGKPRRRHRGGRRRSGKAEQPKQTAPAEQKSEKRSDGKKPADKKADKKPEKKAEQPKRTEKKQGEKKPRAPKAEKKVEQPKQAAPQQAPKGEGGDKKPRRRPHHRGGRRRGGKGGEGSAPKGE